MATCPPTRTPAQPACMRARCLKHFPNALLAVVLLATASATSAQECAVPPRGLVYWLTGDGDYDDHAGFHNGSASGEVSFIEGRVGPALRFVGDAASLATDTSTEEMAAVADTFTYEFWARPEATAPDCPESQSGNCSGTPQPFAVFPVHGGSDGTVAGVGIVVGTNAVCVAEHAALHLPCLLRLDTAITGWTHIAVVMENKLPRLYLNGQLARTGLASSREHAFASWAVIGSGLGLGDYEGDLDELSLYDHALTDAEIQGIFAAEGAGKCKPDCSIEHHDDLFEHAGVTATSGILSSNPDGLFGATNVLPEVDSLLFQDNQPDGFSHSIEWRTAVPVTLERFALWAFAGQPPTFQRAFRDFKLFARDLGSSQFVPVYASSVRTPYPIDAGNYMLHRCANLRPRVAQEFRAEFVQHGEGNFFGPRVMELDGFGPDLIFACDFEAAAE